MSFPRVGTMSTSAPDGTLDRLLAWLRPRVLLVDLLWAVLWGGLSFLFQPPFDMAGGGEAWWLALTAAVTVALVFRRTRPRVVIAVLAVVLVLHVLTLDVFTLTSLVGAGAAAYTAHAQLPATARRVTTIALALGTLWAALDYSHDVLALAWWQRWPVVLAHWVIVAFFCLLGALARKRREEVERAVERAELMAERQAQEVRLAALGERTHIAREMHDIIAHSLGVIIAQADGGRYAAAQDPDAAARSLQTIAGVGRASLAEMRQLLSVLRSDEARDLLPAPGLDDLDELAEDYRKAGLRVRLSTTGEPVDLPDTTALTVYRVVQESLANVLQHAGRTSVDAQLAWQSDRLVVTVRHPLPDQPTPDNPGGHGLVGMRERVALHDGTLTAGPVDHQWLVRAEIPVAYA